MNLIPEWKTVLKRGWSTWGAYLSFLFGALEGLVQAIFFFGSLPDWMHPGVFLGLAMTTNAVIPLLRVVKQKGLSDE
jgi:hypothetical protein